MSRSAKELSKKSRESTLLQEFENSLPDFKNLDKEEYLKFVKAIRLLCRHFDISENRLQRDNYSKLKSTVAHLSELYEEYLSNDTIIASAVSFVKLHVASHYLRDQDATLVHNLTSLHVYLQIPDCASDESDGAITAKGAPDRIRESMGRLVDRILGLANPWRGLSPTVVNLLREGRRDGE